VLTSTVAGAAEISLPSGLLISDKDGIRVSVNGEYCIQADSLEAGDVITKQLVIQNTEPYPYHLSMTTTPLEEAGPLKLLDEVGCTLRIDGKTIYDGRIRGDEGANMIEEALDLGTIPSGAQKTLDITLRVNPAMTKYHWTKSESLFTWNFNAIQEGKTADVKTGQIISSMLVGIFSAILIALFVLILTKKREEELLSRQTVLTVSVKTEDGTIENIRF
jgi:hypothetical protein